MKRGRETRKEEEGKGVKKGGNLPRAPRDKAGSVSSMVGDRV